MSKLVTSPKLLIFIPLLLLLMLAVACGADATPTPVVIEKEVIKEVEVPVEVEKEVIKEVEVTREVVKEVVKEVEKEVVKEVEVTKEVIKEVIKEVEKEVVKEVEVVATPTAAPPTPTLRPTATPTIAPRVTPKPTPTAPPAKVEPKVELLKVMLSPSFFEQNTNWDSHPSETTQQIRHMMDTLLTLDPFTSKTIPGLATELELLTPDAKNWGVKLRKGVEFHDGWGEFTARDVRHSFALMTQEACVNIECFRHQTMLGTTPAIADDVIDYETPLTETIEIVNDYEVIFHNLVPRIDMDFVITSKNGSTFMFSREYWDATGVKGARDIPIGTGSWEYVDRGLTQFLEMKAVPDHWRKTPGFPRIRIIWAREDATRLAALLTGESHMAALPRDLYGQARQNGMAVHKTTGPANFVLVGFGGLYREDHEWFKPGLPILDKRVREAFNHAINRDELIEEIFAGDADKMLVAGFHPLSEGWNTDWEKNFERDYGYDPDRARELLAEAGYGPDNPIKIKSVLTELAQLPEMRAIGEALAIYLNDVGVDASTLDMEFAAFVPLFREGKLHNTISVLPSGSLLPIDAIRAFAWSLPTGSVAYSESKFIDERYPLYRASLDLEERETLVREMGQYKYDEYLEIPLVWVFGEIVVDPNIVADVTIPGGILGVFGEWAFVEPVPK